MSIIKLIRTIGICLMLGALTYSASAEVRQRDESPPIENVYSLTETQQFNKVVMILAVYQTVDQSVTAIEVNLLKIDDLFDREQSPGEQSRQQALIATNKLSLFNTLYSYKMIPRKQLILIASNLGSWCNLNA